MLASIEKKLYIDTSTACCEVFHSYREEGWDGYDYKLGTQELGWEYWKAVERGEKPPVPRKNNALFDVILSRLP